MIKLVGVAFLAAATWGDRREGLRVALTTLRGILQQQEVQEAGLQTLLKAQKERSATLKTLAANEFGGPRERGKNTPSSSSVWLFMNAIPSHVIAR